MSTRVHEPAPAPAARALTPAPRLLVQRDASSAHGIPATAPASVHRALSSPGRPLDPDTRGYMESRFGHDFSQVRVHTDSLAAESAREISAHAYTVGSDIAFAAGRYQPETQAGRQLLAHELAHTVQQSGLQRRASDLAVDVAPDSRLEYEAESAARAVASGHSAPALAARAPGPVVSRAAGDITTAPATAPKKKPFISSAGTHQVIPTGLATLETDNKGNTDTLREFEVEPFFLPATKGPAAFAIYDSMAKGGSLESTLELTGTGKTKTALWQERPDTDDLRSIWLQKVGWTSADSKTVDDLWKRAGGASEFPKVNSATGLVTAQMDHIVELQIGGNNAKENIQPLDPTPNQSSGGAIKSQLQSLAQKIAADAAFAGPDTQQVKMRFKSVKQVGTPETLVTTAPAANAKRSALSVEARALTLKVTATAGGGIAIARDDYPISSGGRPPTNLRVPTTFAATTTETVAIKGDSENDPASTLIPGLLLNTLKHGKVGKTKSDLIEAQIDDRDKTRLPITIDSAVKPFDVIVAADGKLSLPTALKKTALGFTYKYLSPGTITSVEMGADGSVNWTGTITPKARFLPTLDVVYKEGTLKLVAQIPEEKLKKAKLFGATITKASLDIVLSPFDISGNLEFVFGDVKKPAATGSLKIFKDDQGLVGTAKLLLNIPKVDSTEFTFEYKGGTGRDDWSGEFAISTSQIKLPYVTNSSLVARVSSKDGVTSLTFDGKVSLELPNKRGTAEVGLKRWEGNWFLSGGARFNIPKVEDFSAWITYDIARETLTASVPGEDGKAPPKPITFTITEDFKGTLDRFKITVAKGGIVTVTGAGGFNFKKGKASGSVRVELAEDGSFNGSGSLTYALNDKITVNGTVEFKEKGKPRLRITGSLTFARLELMKQIGDTKTLFDKEFSIPIPYASIGGVGLKAIFGVNLTAGYSLGPIVIEPLTFTAGFNPMEDEPQLDLGVTGELKVPATATLSASLSGGVKLDAYVAEIGGKITITGTIELTGGLFVPFKGTYSNQEFAVETTPEARLKLLLGVALSASVWAKAGVGWLSTGVTKTWKLGERKVDPHLGFGIKAPISYSSKTGAKIPSLDQITFVQPDFSRDNLSRVADELFGAAKGDPADA
jgi:hypothetical protein